MRRLFWSRRSIKNSLSSPSDSPRQRGKSPARLSVVDEAGGDGSKMRKTRRVSLLKRRRLLVDADSLSVLLVISTSFVLTSAVLKAQTPSADEILRKVDQTCSENKVILSRMVIHGERGSRTVEVKSWQRSTRETFSEFLAPARDKGTKMLKLQDMLWTYSPSTDRSS